MQLLGRQVRLVQVPHPQEHLGQADKGDGGDQHIVGVGPGHLVIGQRLLRLVEFQFDVAREIGSVGGELKVLSVQQVGEVFQGLGVVPQVVIG